MITLGEDDLGLIFFTMIGGKGWGGRGCSLRCFVGGGEFFSMFGGTYAFPDALWKRGVTYLIGEPDAYLRVKPGMTVLHAEAGL